MKRDLPFEYFHTVAAWSLTIGSYSIENIWILQKSIDWLEWLVQFFIRTAS